MDCTVHRHSHTFTATYTPRHNRNGQTEAPSCCLNATVLLFWPRLVFNYQGCPNVHNQHNQHGVDYVQIIMNKYNLNLSKSLEKICLLGESKWRVWVLVMISEFGSWPPSRPNWGCVLVLKWKMLDQAIWLWAGEVLWVEILVWVVGDGNQSSPTCPPPFSHWFICKLRLETFMSPLRPYQHHTG